MTPESSPANSADAERDDEVVSTVPDSGVLPCGHCGADAYTCDRPHHGSATWAIHCTAKPHHNYFAEANDG